MVLQKEIKLYFHEIKNVLTENVLRIMYDRVHCNLNIRYAFEDSHSVFDMYQKSVGAGGSLVSSAVIG